ncbi:MFS transporter [Leisingera aquimarina]|uniref:MFS transporter n=1 Tax=Leisingera aquimarina TaxID=476529 RepID=UPI001B7FDDCD|nr:MFS transporter [Leisingera aquimarina]
MAALILQLTGSPLAVGAVPAILRLGWLTPQIFVGYFAERSGASMPFYAGGAFGRTAAIALLAAVLWHGSAADWRPVSLGAAALALWTLYAFVSGIVGVPYNDIVARSVPSNRRSRLLALRFFGGGLVALAVAALADHIVRTADFPVSYAAVLWIAAALMLVSSVVFVSMGEPERAGIPKGAESFAAYFREGRMAFRNDTRFRWFVFAQWCGGATLIAAPFYVVAAAEMGLGLENIALLLGAQTSGALASNLLWGWWGDTRGKLSLMRLISFLRLAPPLILLAVLFLEMAHMQMLIALVAVFLLLGALANGLTIAVLGLLMEISPEHRRPSYSGYFNALTAPAFVLPLLGGVIYAAIGAEAVFFLSAVSAVGQGYALAQIR